MLFQLLASSNWGSWLMIGILMLVFVAFSIFNRHTQKKQQEKTMQTLNAIKPGNKVKTIGGICGVVVEVCDDNTFVLETGTEKSGKSYLKFDKQAVYQTDAVPEVQTVETKEKAKTEEVNQTEVPEEEKAE